MANWQSSLADKLLDALLTLENRDEARRFLRDLLTPQEMLEFDKRWQVARMLDAGLPYYKIEKQTGMSSTTVARVSKFLNGKHGGYRLVLERLGNQKPTTSGMEYLKKINKDSSPEVYGSSKYSFGTQNSAQLAQASLQSHHHSQHMLEGG